MPCPYLIGKYLHSVCDAAANDRVPRYEEYQSYCSSEQDADYRACPSYLASNAVRQTTERRSRGIAEEQ